jgi:hypothetical protein
VFTHKIEKFSSTELGQRESSEPFTICGQQFRLLVFPNGNPHAHEHSGKALSAYLQVANIENQNPGWSMSVVFTLDVIHRDNLPENQQKCSTGSTSISSAGGNSKNSSAANLSWSLPLTGCRYNHQHADWGVHCLAPLSTLTDEKNGYLHDDTLTLRLRGRFMELTVEIVTEEETMWHNGFGVADFKRLRTINLLFCATLLELQEAVSKELQLPVPQMALWCFNQCCNTGQPLRPRRLLSRGVLPPDQSRYSTILVQYYTLTLYSYAIHTAADDHPLLLPLHPLLLPLHSPLQQAPLSWG